jgi:signal transduction histidine kinase
MPPHALPAEARHNLYLAVKETIHNVVKHARATEVWLRMVETDEAFTISIEDNGCGLKTVPSPESRVLSPKAPAPSGNGRGTEDSGLRTQDRLSCGHGLDNLEKRLAACGGRCVVTSEPGKGTRVALSVNFAALS